MPVSLREPVPPHRTPRRKGSFNRSLTIDDLEIVPDDDEDQQQTTTGSSQRRPSLTSRNRSLSGSSLAATQQTPTGSSQRRPSLTSSSKNRSSSSLARQRSQSELDVEEMDAALEEAETLQEEEEQQRNSYDEPPKRSNFATYADQDEELHSKDFPEERARRLGIFSPQSHDRFYWDLIVLLLMLWVLYVVPFELAFVQTSRNLDAMFFLNVLVDVGFFVDILVNLNTGYFDTSRHAWVIARKKIVQRYVRSWRFVVDFVALMRWKTIFYGLVGASAHTQHLHYIRLIRLIRLFQLIRLVKAPEMMARIARRIAVSYKTQLVSKYFLVLVSLLHLEACAIRIVHDILRRNRRHLDVSTFLSTTHRLYRPKFVDGHFNGNFALYVDCLDWAFQTLLGQSMYTNTTEGVLSLLNNFCGVMFISFLIGEVANVMCNLDPAKNEYKQTVDMLNAYMAEHKFPEDMRWQLRMYLAHSEDLFRARFHDDLVQRLSPPLQELVAHFMLGARVMKTPFFAYARRCTLGMVPGRRIFITPPDLRTVCSGNWSADSSSYHYQDRRSSWLVQRIFGGGAGALLGGSSSEQRLSDKVAPMMSPNVSKDLDWNDSLKQQQKKKDLPECDSGNHVMTLHEIHAIMEFWRHNKVRPAEITRCCDDGSYDVKYLDDYGGFELNVHTSRISQKHEPIEVQRAMDHMNHVSKLIVTQFARAMKQCLYNNGDYVSRKGVTHTNRMIIVDQGGVVTFGEDVTRVFSILSYREGCTFGSGELAMLAAGHESRLAWYNARALVMTRVLILEADDFLDAISMPGFEQFFKCVKRFGKWTHFRLAVWFAIREGVLEEAANMDHFCEDVTSSTFYRRLDEPKVVQTSFAAKKRVEHHPHAQRINEAMLAGAASNHFERLLATKLALQSRHTETLLEKTAKSLDKLCGRLDTLETKALPEGGGSSPPYGGGGGGGGENFFIPGGGGDCEDPRLYPNLFTRRPTPVVSTSESLPGFPRDDDDDDDGGGHSDDRSAAEHLDHYDSAHELRPPPTIPSSPEVSDNYLVPFCGTPSS